MTFQVGKYSGEVTGPFDSRAGSGLDINANLISDNMGETGLTQAGRPVKKGMVEGLSPLPGSGDSNGQVFTNLILAGKLGKGTRPEARIERSVLCAGITGCNTGDIAPPVGCLQFTGNSQQLARE